MYNWITVEQKLTQHCKSTVLQLKENKFRRECARWQSRRSLSSPPLTSAYPGDIDTGGSYLGSLFCHVDTGAGKGHFDINVGTPLAKQLIRHECSPTHQQIGFLKTPLAHCLPPNISAHERTHTSHKKRPVCELALPLAGQHKFQENPGPTEKFIRNWTHPPAILHLL